MEIVNTLQNRKISFFISKCINIQNIQNLNSKYDKNILIENIDRLNKYITINNNNIEIYGIKDNIINTYFISNNSNIEENYLKLIRELMKKYNLDKWIINIFNNIRFIPQINHSYLQNIIDIICSNNKEIFKNFIICFFEQEECKCI
jgi:uncharacterized membrane protein